MTLAEIIDCQKNFDKKHVSTFDWDQPITQDNIGMLKYLLLCMVGELGETTNIVKKILRGDCKLDDVKEDLSEEIVDMFIYVVKLSYQLGFDLEEGYMNKLAKNKIRFARYETDE